MSDTSPASPASPASHEPPEPPEPDAADPSDASGLEGAVVSIVRHVDGEAVVVRGRLVARQPSSLTVQLDQEYQLPTGVALAVVVHGPVPVVGLGNFSAGNDSVVTIRLAERRG